MKVFIDGIEVEIDENCLDIAVSHVWKLNKKKFDIQGQYYFQAAVKGRTIHLHREIMGCVRGDKKYVDHISGDTLDCRKKNLRICTNAENIRNRKINRNNTSGYKGVHFSKKNKKWKATIMSDKKLYTIGSFQTPEEAYAAWCGAAKILHGNFARYK